MRNVRPMVQNVCVSILRFPTDLVPGKSDCFKVWPVLPCRLFHIDHGGVSLSESEYTRSRIVSSIIFPQSENPRPKGEGLSG